MPTVFDAVIVAASPHAHVRVLGLTLAERGARVATRVGARRVFVVDSAEAAARLARWEEQRGEAAVLVIRAGDQIVHTALVEPMLRGTRARRIAVGPEGSYAGALWIDGDVAAEVVAAIAAAPETADLELARRLADAEHHPHGDIARHPATTPAERAAGTRMLLRLIVKSEDSPVTKYIYRPLSRPITRLLLHTPITPNQVSILVGLIGLVGCWLTAQPGQRSLVGGAALVLAAGVIDGCDGELARLRLTSSKIGAWLDTIIDELTTTVYFVAIGYHTHVHDPRPWIVPGTILGVTCYLASIYAIYYFLIVVSKTGNSQHYVGDLELVDGTPGGLRPRRRGPSKVPPWLRHIGSLLTLVVRRDFINLGALFITFANAYFFIYVMMLLGGVISAAIVIPEHLKLRGLLREVERRGASPQLLSPDH